jgi:hypothetical protein
MAFSSSKFFRMLRASLFACLVLFSARTFAADGTVLPKALPTEELEKYGDAPAFVWRTDVSPAMVSQHGVFTSYQANVDANGQNIVGDAANEPSICVDPTNPNRMSIGWRQFDSVGNNFRKAGWGYTSNGGTSWSFPGTLETIFRSDPVLASDDTGRFFYLSLQNSLLDDMFRSLNGGASWTKLGPATGGDKQWFTIDNTNSPGRGFQYQIWSTASNPTPGRQFSRSTDGGFTWMNPISIPRTPVWGTLDVDTNGTLFIGGVNPGNASQIWCVRSSNASNGAVIPSFDLSTQINLGGNIDASDIINPAGLTGQITLAVDRSGTSTNNNVYMLASVQPTGFTTGSDVMFVRSTNGGQSFSAPRRINDDPVNHSKWHWLGTLSVAPNGRIDAVWLDSRNAANNTDSQLFYSYSSDGGDTWSPNVSVSAAFNPYLGYPNQNKMGDYIGLVSDNAGGNVAYTATFNLEEDIYYTRVAPPAPQLLNISTRARVLTEEQRVIAGFIITGTEPKKVLLRGMGPSLNGVGVILSDPTLELLQGSTTLATNDNWKTRTDGTSQQAEVEGTTIPPANELESAIVTTLSPGTYTAILAGKNGGTGVGLMEVYDLAQPADSRLANISTRGFVDKDDNVLIGGLTVRRGNVGARARVLIRAIGPSLTNSGIQDPLPDPTLELHDGNGTTTATNDNWKINDQTLQSQEAEVRATTIPPPNDLESAIITTLPPGIYTAVVRGKNNATGIGLVEVYNLP